MPNANSALNVRNCLLIRKNIAYRRNPTEVADRHIYLVPHDNARFNLTQGITRDRLKVPRGFRGCDASRAQMAERMGVLPASSGRCSWGGGPRGFRPGAELKV